MPIGRILVATDFSEASRAALRYAEMLATHDGSELHILHVLPDARRESWASEAAGLDLDDLTEDWIRDAEGKLQRIANQVPTALEVHTTTRVGLLPDEILRYAEETEAGLIVVGTHGREVVGRLLLGSVAEAMLRRAPCPVLTLHAGVRGASSKNHTAPRRRGASAALARKTG